MTNQYILDGNFLNKLDAFCSDRVFYVLSEKKDLTKSTIYCVKSKDAIDKYILENMDIVIDFINSLYPYQYRISICDNYRKSGQYKFVKKYLKKGILNKDFAEYQGQDMIGYEPVDKEIILPFGDRTIIGNTNGILNVLDQSTNHYTSFNYIHNDIEVNAFKYEISKITKKETLYENEITFKIDYLTVSKNFNMHSCWQLFNSVLRMIDNPFEQGILRTYINLVKNKKYKDYNKFFLFGIACAFPDHNKKVFKNYDNDKFKQNQGTYGHLTLSHYNRDGHQILLKKNEKTYIPVFKTKIDIDEKYRDISKYGNIIFDESLISEDHTSNIPYTERTTSSCCNVYNKNYSGVLSEFNIVDIPFKIDKKYYKGRIDSIYKDIDYFIKIANIYIGNYGEITKIVTCIKENRDKGFFLNRSYYEIDDAHFINEFNIIEEISNEHFNQK